MFDGEESDFSGLLKFSRPLASILNLQDMGAAE